MATDRPVAYASGPGHTGSFREQVAQFQSGASTPRDYLERFLDQIGQSDGEIQAFVTLTVDAAREAADASGKRYLDGNPVSPIDGLPLGLKDIIQTGGVPTQSGSPIYKDWVPERDSPVTAALKRDGAVIVGKTATTEFAAGAVTPARNPYDPARTPGTSSSGSAAAVGARMVPVAFGTQTTGSTIRPAAFCGTVGYKPSFGDLSLTGVRDNSPSLDTLGLIARSVADLALFRSAVMVLPFEALAEVEVNDLQIGVCRTPWWDQAESYTQELLADVAGRLSGAGADVSDFEMPKGAAELVQAMRSVSGFEFARVMLHERLHHSDQLSRKLLDGRVNDGINCSYEDYREALATLESYRGRFGAAMEGYDLLLTPSATGEAPEGIDSTGIPVFNLPWTATYAPAVTLPAGEGPKGLPIGVQLVGRRNDDYRFLAAAQAVERLLDYPG